MAESNGVGGGRIVWLSNRGSDAPQSGYNDPGLAGYWHLVGSEGATKGVNAVKAWLGYRGAGVVVGVIDDGIDYTHPELTANYAFDLDYDSRDADYDAYPTDSTDRHGTTVAGVIAAGLNNGAGGAGVAPAATVAGYRIGFGSNGTYEQLVGAFQWMASVDVANNSWGFDGFLGDSFRDPEFTAIGEALQNALEVGRGGLGTIVVFAAGNGRTSGQDVNYHGLQNNRGIISAAGTDSAGNITWFSTPGAALLVAAPGQGITTTDRLGAAGYSSGDYATMSGTSFSSPIASGVAALMLDANPGLGWRDVQEILAATAVQSGVSAGWLFNRAENWNGGAMHVSHDYGFGLVDAYAAVRVAESWRAVSTSANEAVAEGVAYPGSAIPEVGSMSSTIALAQGVRIDHVEIDVSLLHDNIGQLEISLISPAGTRSVLFHNPGTSQDNVYFTFSTTRDWGESSGGNWTLTVADTQTGASGTLVSWAVRAYGDLIGDDTYVYTEEFNALAVVESSRLLLSDGGGVDTVNTAAIATDTLLDLRPGHASSIDGQRVVISVTADIENADSGDGNDTLIGNDAGNSLRGWRGSDFLDGGSGADTLVGGPGDDTYIIDSMGDVIVEASGEGADYVRTMLAAYRLDANLEGLAYIGAGAFSGTGNAAPNSISGGTGSDTLDGDAGADTMIGGGGDDSYTVDNADEIVVELEGEGNDIIYSRVGWTLGPNVERLYLSGSAAVNGTGNDLANTLYGNGNPAANGLAGGVGNDVYHVGSDDTITEASAQGSDSVFSYGGYTLGANLENLYLYVSVSATLSGNELANNLRGNAGNDSLIGWAGNDTLYGGPGQDTLRGGAGDDGYYVDNVSDSVVEVADEGNDTIYSTIGWTLGAGGNIERLYLFGSASVNATGNELANTLYGHANSAANVLAGGIGNDLYYVAAGDTVVEHLGEGNDSVSSYGAYSLPANVENLYLNVPSAAALTGNELANSLIGNAGNDTLIGLEGNDALNGGSGADTMRGGQGDDQYYVENAFDSVVELGGEGYDIIYSNIGWTLADNIERLYLSGSTAINATGNELANTLYGNGNSAANELIGGLGNDTYHVGGNDTVTEQAGQGNDTVYGYGDYSLVAKAANVENLFLYVATAASLTGNDLANNLRGHNSADTLSGLAGNDTLDGGPGADTLIGGSGDDILLGGSGFDRFVFGAAFGKDRVNDFTPGQDQIQLSIAFGLLDSNGDLVLNRGDGGVQIVGSDLLISLGNDQILVVGQSQLHSNDFLLA